VTVAILLAIVVLGLAALTALAVWWITQTFPGG
jgi:hypothetical protein